MTAFESQPTILSGKLLSLDGNVCEENFTVELKQAACAPRGFIFDDGEDFYNSMGCAGKDWEDAVTEEKNIRAFFDEAELRLQQCDDIDRILDVKENIINEIFAKFLDHLTLDNRPLNTVSDIRVVHYDEFMDEIVIVHDDFSVSWNYENCSWGYLPAEVLKYLIGPNYEHMKEVLDKVDDRLEQEYSQKKEAEPATLKTLLRQ